MKHIPSVAWAVEAMSTPVSCSAPKSRFDQSFNGKKMVPALVFSPPPIRSKPLMAKAWKTAGFSAGVWSSDGTIFVM